MAGFPSNKDKNKPAPWEALEEFRKKVRDNYPGKGLSWRKVTPELFSEVINLMYQGANTLKALKILDIHPKCLYDYLKDNPDLDPTYQEAKVIAAEIICDDMENLATEAIGTDASIFRGIDLTINTRKWCANRVLENKSKLSQYNQDSTPPVNIVINPVGTAEVIPPKPTT